MTRAQEVAESLVPNYVHVYSRLFRNAYEDLKELEFLCFPFNPN